MDCACFPHAFDVVVELDLDCVFESDELAEIFDFPFWRKDVDVDPLNCYRITFLGFDVVLKMCFFVGCRCKPCAVVAVVTCSGIVVVCMSEPLMRRMSSANLRFERFVSVPCSANLAPWLPLFHFSVSGFIMNCKSVEQERAE